MSGEDPKEKIKRLIKESVPAGAKVIDFAAEARMRGREKASSPVNKKTAKAELTITGNNNAGVVGDGNSIHIHVRSNARPKIQIQKGPESIDDAQAAEIKELVNKVAAVSGKPYQRVYNALYNKFRVTSYHLIHRQDYGAACAYLRGWIARGGGVTATETPDEKRKKLLSRIHAQAKKTDGQIELVRAYAAGRHGTHKLSELTVGQLQDLIRHYGL